MAGASFRKRPSHGRVLAVASALAIVVGTTTRVGAASRPSVRIAAGSHVLTVILQSIGTQDAPTTTTNAGTFLGLTGYPPDARSVNDWYASVSYGQFSPWYGDIIGPYDHDPSCDLNTI